MSFLLKRVPDAEKRLVAIPSSCYSSINLGRVCQKPSQAIVEPDKPIPTYIIYEDIALEPVLENSFVPTDGSINFNSNFYCIVSMVTVWLQPMTWSASVSMERSVTRFVKFSPFWRISSLWQILRVLWYVAKFWMYFGHYFILLGKFSLL